ncbi:hypothetical protein DUI87_05948 [Hirundo rustica rustica]|uniref:Uncharacterized protein n=1 Tax=Hirundo rustica rustica TaxID=333673 RepID=A0A3M0LDZ8_HIRRU|nr:hypothetical protein DUI87_05948 [Hirundo rustica rustica]
MTHNQLSAECKSIHHYFGPTYPDFTQETVHPSNPLSSQFFQENTVGNGVKGYHEVQVDNMPLFLIHQTGHLVTEDQVNQARPAFPKPILAGPDALLVPSLLMICSVTFPGINIKLAGLQFPRSFFQTFLQHPDVVRPAQRCRECEVVEPGRGQGSAPLSEVALAKEGGMIEGIVKHWNSMPKEVVESSSLKVFEEQLDMTLSAVV